MNGFWEVSSCECPLVPRAGVFLTFGQLAGNGLPLSRMIVCLPCEFSSLHGNDLAGQAHSIVRFTRASVRFSVLIGGSWGFCGFLQLKKKKFISHVQDGGEVPFYLWASVLGRRVWCSEALLNMHLNSLLKLGKKDLWLLFSIFSLFLWASFCVSQPRCSSYSLVPPGSLDLTQVQWPSFSWCAFAFKNVYCIKIATRSLF